MRLFVSLPWRLFFRRLEVLTPRAAIGRDAAQGRYTSVDSSEGLPSKPEEGEIDLNRMMKSVTVAAGLVVFLFPVVALSQEDHYTFTVSALGGVGGSLDEETGFGNQSFQLGLAVLREDLVHVGLRLNRTEFDAGDRLNTMHDATLTYLTLGAEYRYVESFYLSASRWVSRVTFPSTTGLPCWSRYPGTSPIWRTRETSRWPTSGSPITSRIARAPFQGLAPPLPLPGSRA
jgi:hypothetical protein